jgi:hypothetical protein
MLHCINNSERKNSLSQIITMDKSNNEYKEITLSKKAEILKVGNYYMKDSKHLSNYDKYDLTVLGNPQYVVEYIREIVSHLKETEVYLLKLED